MKRAALVALALLAGCAALPDTAPEPLAPLAPERFAIDLETAMALAGARDPELRLARAAEEQARNDVLKAGFSLLPTFLPFFRAFNHQGRAQPQTGIIVDVSRTNYELQVLGLVYFDPGPAVFATLAARRRVAAAAARTEAERQEAVLRAATGYLELVAAHARVAVARAAVSAAEELLRRAESRERLGAGIAADTLAARAERAARQADLAHAQGEVTRASAALAAELQLAPGVELVPRDRTPPLLEIEPPAAPLEELVARAREGIRAGRPEALAAREETAARERITEGTEYGPLVPFLSAGNAPVILQLLPLTNLPRAPKDEDDVNQPRETTYYYPTREYVKGWSGGLINGPLIPFAGFFAQSGLFGPTLGTMRYSHDLAGLVGWSFGPRGIGDVPRIRAARLSEQRARLDEEALGARIQREVSVAVSDLKSARSRLAAAREEVTQATESARLSRDRLEKGVAIELEVLEAERALTRALTREVEALVADDEAQLRLRRALGEPP